MENFRAVPTCVDRLYVAQCIDPPSCEGHFECFRLPMSIKYHPYCDDFGPMNLYCIVEFIRLLDSKLSCATDKKILFCVDDGLRPMTNAVFLLGAYMILKQGKTADEVASSFEWLDGTVVEPYRDATFTRPDFQLQLVDCWRGLEKGVQQGWVRYAGPDYMWGEIDVDEYQHYDNPANGDLQEVVPGKFVALKGPSDLGGAEFHDDARGVRTFSPTFYAEILRDMGVSTVVRLNEPRYRAQELTSHGFEHHSLEFPDCTCPPDHVVAKFLRIVDAAPGAVAVHCHAGLGRTGTLIALYMMRSCGFRAREAMGWLRIMRPGSVIGQQQHYLVAIDDALQAALARRRGDRGSGSSSADRTADIVRVRSAEAPSVLAEQVSNGMIRRAASSTSACSAAP